MRRLSLHHREPLKQELSESKPDVNQEQMARIEAEVRIVTRFDEGEGANIPNVVTDRELYRLWTERSGGLTVWSHGSAGDA